MFQLHPQLEKNLIHLAELSLCRALLSPDSDNPWVVLVPRRADIKEWHQLAMEDQKQLLVELNLVSRILEKEFEPDKINIGALGNVVPQFHLHIIGRYKDDKVWPGAIWGSEAGCNREIITARAKLIREQLTL